MLAMYCHEWAVRDVTTKKTGETFPSSEESFGTCEPKDEHAGIVLTRRHAGNPPRRISFSVKGTFRQFSSAAFSASPKPLWCVERYGGPSRFVGPFRANGVPFMVCCHLPPPRAWLGARVACRLRQT